MLATRAFWMWVKGTKTADKELIVRAKEYCLEVLTRFKRVYLLENYAETILLYRRICESLGIAPVLSDNIDMSQFNKWIDYKYEWLGKML